MGGIYIRSQTKNEIYVLNNSLAIRCKGTDESGMFTGRHYIFLIGNDRARYELGSYKNRERCIEILDEIEEKCGQYLYANGSLGLIQGSAAIPPMAAAVPRVYDMPEK